VKAQEPSVAGVTIRAILNFVVLTTRVDAMLQTMEMFNMAKFLARTCSGLFKNISHPTGLPTSLKPVQTYCNFLVNRI
jgi:hypothetical protein